MAEHTLQRVRSRFAWDKSRLQYRNARGQFVKASDVRQALLNVADAQQRKIRRLAADLSSGKISVAKWQEAMEAAVKELHLAAHAAGRGGFGQMTQRDYGLAGSGLRFQFTRIGVFARKIEEGQLSEGRIRNYAQMYAAAAKGVYENARREAAIQGGELTEERRVLGAVAEHCEDCVVEAVKQWQPLGTLRRLNDSRCGSNCGCRFQFR